MFPFSVKAEFMQSTLYYEKNPQQNWNKEYIKIEITTKHIEQ